MKLEDGIGIVAWGAVVALGVGCSGGGAALSGGAGGQATETGTGGVGGAECPAGAHQEAGACRSAIAGWATAPELPQATDHHVSFIVEGDDADHLLVVGGFDGTGVVNDVRRAAIDHGVVGSWETMAPLPEVMSGQGLAIIGDRLVLTGGRRNGFAIQPTTNIGTISAAGELTGWTLGPPMGLSRFHHTTVVHEGAIYVIGGLVGDGTNNTDNVARLSSLDGAWVDVTPLPAPRSHHCSLAHAGRLFVAGGLTGNPAGSHTSHRDVLSAKIESGGELGPWTAVSELPATLATHACFVHGDHLYVVGGVRDGATFSDEVLRAAIDAEGQLGPWTPQPSLPRSRAHTHQTPQLDGFVYSAGGRDDGQSIADVFVGEFR